MATITSEIQSLAPSALVELFELDTTVYPDGGVFYFHAGTNKVTQPVVWQGKTYQPLPIEASGFELSSKGTLPRPRITVANVGGLFSAEVIAHDDLIGCKVTRRRTFARFLDSDNFPGFQGYGLNRTATSGWVSVPNSTSLQITGDLTICLKVKPTSFAAQASILHKATGGEFSVFQGTDGKVTFEWGTVGGNGTPSQKVTSTNSLILNQYNFIVIRRKVGAGGSITVNVNGTQTSAAPTYAAAVASANAVVVGSGFYGNYLGVIDKLVIFNRAVSDTDQATYLADGLIPENQAKLKFDFEQSLNDLSGNSNNGTAVGTVQYIKIAETNSEANPNQYLPDEIWYIDRKVLENRYVIQFELASAMDLNGVRLPYREVIQNACVWKYRSAECGYTGTLYFDANDKPTTVNNDFCSKRLNGCRLRFGTGNTLPYGGFPGAVRYE